MRVWRMVRTQALSLSDFSPFRRNAALSASRGDESLATVVNDLFLFLLSSIFIEENSSNGFHGTWVMMEYLENTNKFIQKDGTERMFILQWVFQ